MHIDFEIRLIYTLKIKLCCVKKNLIIEDNNTTMLDGELEDEGEERIFPVEDDQEIIVLPNPNINEAVILKKLWNKKLKSSILKIMLINKIELFLFIYGV